MMDGSAWTGASAARVQLCLTCAKRPNPGRHNSHRRGRRRAAGDKLSADGERADTGTEQMEVHPPSLTHPHTHMRTHSHSANNGALYCTERLPSHSDPSLFSYANSVSHRYTLCSGVCAQPEIETSCDSAAVEEKLPRTLPRGDARTSSPRLFTGLPS